MSHPTTSSFSTSDARICPASLTSIDWRFWSRYRTQLVRKHIPQPAINALDRVTNRTLELTGNPAAPAPFNRRGMVVGDVQAGNESIGFSRSTAEAKRRIKAREQGRKGPKTPDGAGADPF